MKEATENGKSAPKNAKPIASHLFDDGTIVEMIFKPSTQQTALCVSVDGEWQEKQEIEVNGQRFIPFSGKNNLILNEVILFPSKPEEYGTNSDLAKEIQEFLHRYVQVGPAFEQIAAYYILFSWVHDAFNELPYLRARGDFGSGKTRFLLIAGSLVYKGIFASGASTIAPLFRILDSFGGTLIIDEGDFRQSDEKSDLSKILNNGNVRGFPVLRCEVSPNKAINPQAFHVFGPKIMASRSLFDDPALESRFITEEMGQAALRQDLPINLPKEYKAEALALRNKLLMFRFRNFHKCRIDPAMISHELEPRLNQIFAPLLSIIEDAAAKAAIQELARQYSRELSEERGSNTEAHLLIIIRELLRTSTQVSVKDITSRFVSRHGNEYERRITARWIGWSVRKRLGLKTTRLAGSYYLAARQEAQLMMLGQRYALDQDGPDENGELRSTN